MKVLGELRLFANVIFYRNVCVKTRFYHNEGIYYFCSSVPIIFLD